MPSFSPTKHQGMYLASQPRASRVDGLPSSTTSKRGQLGSISTFTRAAKHARTHAHTCRLALLQGVHVLLVTDGRDLRLHLLIPADDALHQTFAPVRRRHEGKGDLCRGGESGMLGACGCMGPVRCLWAVGAWSRGSGLLGACGCMGLGFRPVGCMRVHGEGFRPVGCMWVHGAEAQACWVHVGAWSRGSGLLGACGCMEPGLRPVGCMRVHGAGRGSGMSDACGCMEPGFRHVGCM